MGRVHGEGRGTRGKVLATESALNDDVSPGTPLAPRGARGRPQWQALREEASVGRALGSHCRYASKQVWPGGPVLEGTSLWRLATPPSLGQGRWLLPLRPAR